jgi:hypothetical protein
LSVEQGAARNGRARRGQGLGFAGRSQGKGRGTREERGGREREQERRRQRIRRRGPRFSGEESGESAATSGAGLRFLQRGDRGRRRGSSQCFRGARGGALCVGHGGRARYWEEFTGREGERGRAREREREEGGVQVLLQGSSSSARGAGGGEQEVASGCLGQATQQLRDSAKKTRGVFKKPPELWVIF